MQTSWRAGIMVFVMLFAVFPSASLAAGDADVPTDFGGRLELDWAAFDSDEEGLDNNLIFRRARLHVGRHLSDNLRFKIQYEFRDSTIEPKSFWLRYEPGSVFRLTAGSFKQPFGLQSTTSSRFNVFMERALPNAFSPGYRMGAMANKWGKAWSTSAGITGGSLDDRHRIDGDGLAAFGRLTLAPWHDEDRLLHLGITVEDRRYDSNSQVRIRARPESRVAETRLVDTRTQSDIDSSLSYVAEFAAGAGQFAFQAEVYGANLVRREQGDLSLSGHYAQASVFLTGEARSYVVETGTFGKLTPKRSTGAWEVALRYSELDLTSRNVDGGMQKNVAWAVNWYASKFTRLSLNYIDAKAQPNRDGDAADASILQFRFRIYR